MTGTHTMRRLAGIFGAGLLAAAAVVALPGTAVLAAEAAPAAPAAYTLKPDEPGPKADAAWMARLLDRGERTVYRGDALETIGMPCGGVAAGQLYVRGDGTLAHWWIFNNVTNTGYGDKCYRTYRPESPLDQGFAIRVRPEGGEAVTRRLSRDDFDAIEFVGEYPIAEIRYRTKDKPGLPVAVDLEVFSPFIPLNARDSALPATVMRFTVKNTSDKAAQADLSGILQNGVLWHEAGKYRGQSRNRVVRGDGLTAVVMDYLEPPPEEPKPDRRVVLFEDFEDDLAGRWTVTGDAGAAALAAGTSANQQDVSGWHGKRFINTYQPGDGPQCTLTSKPFKIAEPYIAFLVGGGNHPGETCMNLLVGGKAVRTVAGRDAEALVPGHWDVREFVGQEATLEIVDRNSGPWGHINIDYIQFANFVPGPPPVAPKEHPGYGDMALAVMDPGAKAGTAAAPGADVAAGDEAVYPFGEKRPGALTATLALAPGEAKTVTFLVTWNFPNRPRVGRMYSQWFKSSLDAAKYVASNFDRLSRETRLFRDTYFDTTLPYWLAARLAMPVSILATETCQWWADGRFYAWEGVGCCEGTCTHVWNYQHATGRLFPELARSTRLMQDLEPTAGFDEKTGLVGFRSNRAYAADGQCGTVLKVYREHLMSPDMKFLDAAWPRVQKAMEFSIGHDGNEDGLIEDTQHNTFDINFEGPNTFVGSLYLAALRATEAMARAKGDAAAADRYHAIAEKGCAGTLERLWNGEYFTQVIPEGKPDKFQYGTGCMADQVFGQGWAHQLGLGYIYPEDKVRTALASVFKYDWTIDVGPYNAKYPPQRWFARPGDGGLFTCAWPKGGRPAEPVLYRDEVWTGIEYQVAGHMLYERMVPEALAIIRAVHDRYDGTHHNPWNEVECGDHYARAMASWGCLLGAEGYVYDGPAGIIGFAPRLTPQDFKAFFTAAEGWGSLVQKRREAGQTNRIEVAWGRLKARTLVFEVPEGAAKVKATVTAAGRRAAATVRQDGPRVTLELAAPAEVGPGQAVEAALTW
ncbi:MAG: hypothetical protein IMZ66_00910 [Planctomycetes bacterium]|nr:hypothetical protein [Planctomycetota bacterium]